MIVFSHFVFCNWFRHHAKIRLKVNLAKLNLWGKKWDEQKHFCSTSQVQHRFLHPLRLSYRQRRYLGSLKKSCRDKMSPSST
jgi:hypothetical protein